LRQYSFAKKLQSQTVSREMLGKTTDIKNYNLDWISVDTAIQKPVLVLFYTVSETGFLQKKQVIQVNPLFKTNIFRFISGHLLF